MSENKFYLTGAYAGLDYDGDKSCKFILKVQPRKEGEAEHTMVIGCTGKNAMLIKSLTPGAGLFASGEIQSREYQGKHYLGLWAWSIIQLQGTRPVGKVPASKTTNNQEVSFEEDDIHF